MLVFQLAASTFAQSDKTPAKETQAPKEMRLNGCIARDARAPGNSTFSKVTAAASYRLTGKGLKKFVGQPRGDRRRSSGKGRDLPDGAVALAERGGAGGRAGSGGGGGRQDAGRRR